MLTSIDEIMRERGGGVGISECAKKLQRTNIWAEIGDTSAVATGNTKETTTRMRMRITAPRSSPPPLPSLNAIHQSSFVCTCHAARAAQDPTIVRRCGHHKLTQMHVDRRNVGGQRANEQ